MIGMPFHSVGTSANLTISFPANVHSRSTALQLATAATVHDDVRWRCRRRERIVQLRQEIIRQRGVGCGTDIGQSSDRAAATQLDREPSIDGHHVTIELATRIAFVDQRFVVLSHFDVATVADHSEKIFLVGVLRIMYTLVRPAPTKPPALMHMLPRAESACFSPLNPDPEVPLIT